MKELPRDLFEVEPLNTLHLSNDETVKLHIQTNDLTKHLNETGKKIQKETNQASCNHDSS